jgi:hypothetical protein
MMNYTFAVLFSALLVSSAFAQLVTTDEYAIYSVVLESIHKEGQETFVILNKTEIIEEDKESEANEEVEVPKKWKVVFKKIKELKIDKDFTEKNKKSVNLQKHFLVKYRHWLVEKGEIDNLLETGRKEAERLKEQHKLKNPKVFQDFSIWKPFYEKYPQADGYFQFSRIGFNKKRSFALLRIEGEGESWKSLTYYILKKLNKRWKIYTSFGSASVSES